MNSFKFIMIIVFILFISCSHTAEYYVEKGNFKKAVLIYEKQIAENPSKKDMIQLMKIYNNDMNDFVSAERILNLFIEHYISCTEIAELASVILTNRAGNLIEQKDLEGAFIYLIKSDSIYGGNKRNNKMLAKTYALIDEIDSAGIYIKKAISLDSLDAETFLIKGNIEYYGNNPANAQKAYLKAIQIDSTYYEAYLNLGILYYNTDNLMYSLRMFKKAIACDSLGIAAYDYVINIYNDAQIVDSSYMYAKIFERKKNEFMEKEQM